MPCKTIRYPLFKPFAQKYLLKERYLPDKNADDVYLLIQENLDWHKKYCHTWEALNTLKIDANHQPTELNRGDECGDENIILAYFTPAHKGDKNEYGIHIKLEGIGDLAYKVSQELNVVDEDSLRIIKISSAYKLYAHELCHAWIEDLCCLIEFSTCRSISDAKEMNGLHYITDVESLCNTAAYGWLHNFFSSSNLIDQEFERDKLLSAFEKVMKKQPPGYKDFKDIKNKPYEDAEFIEQMRQLLVDTYKYSELDALQALEVYFLGNFVRDGSDWCWKPTQTQHCWDELSLWGGEPPLHIEK